MGTVQDVTELRAIKRELRDRERRLADAQALARFGSWWLDVAQDRLHWSDELCRIAGRPTSSSPTVGEFLAMIHPEDVSMLTERIGEAREARFSDTASTGSSGLTERFVMSTRAGSVALTRRGR